MTKLKFRNILILIFMHFQLTSHHLLVSLKAHEHWQKFSQKKNICQKFAKLPALVSNYVLALATLGDDSILRVIQGETNGLYYKHIKIVMSDAFSIDVPQP
jgi:hypothetical protein